MLHSDCKCRRGAAEVSPGVLTPFNVEGAHVRRDVKPSNILLTEDGHAKVSDMGLSRADFFSSSTAFAGTFKYAAPEVLLGRPSNDKVQTWWRGTLHAGLSSWCLDHDSNAHHHLQREHSGGIA